MQKSNLKMNANNSKVMALGAEKSLMSELTVDERQLEHISELSIWVCVG